MTPPTTMASFARLLALLLGIVSLLISSTASAPLPAPLEETETETEAAAAAAHVYTINQARVLLHPGEKHYAQVLIVGRKPGTSVLCHGKFEEYPETEATPSFTDLKCDSPFMRAQIQQSQKQKTTIVFGSEGFPLARSGFNFRRQTWVKSGEDSDVATLFGPIEVEADTAVKFDEVG